MIWTNETKRPVKTIRSGPVKIAIWENKSERGVRFGITVQRLYKDEAGKWQTTTSFNSADIPHLVFASQRADMWIHDQYESGEE